MSDFKTNTLMDNVLEGTYDRPAGVSVISVILALSSGLTLITLLLNLGKLGEASSTIGLPSMLLQAGIGFLGLSGFAASIGMWLGKRWGWWIALFYFTYAVTRNLNVMISISTIANDLDSTQNLGSYYVKYGVRMAWNGYFIYYLCTDNPAYYFGTTEVNKWKAVLMVSAVCLLIFAVTTVSNMVAG